MKSIYAAVLLVVLGFFIAVSPWTTAPVCGSFAILANGKTLPMPCGWTAREEIGIGVLLVLAGLLLYFAKSAEARKVAGIFGVALGVLTVLFPRYITKMCSLPGHLCNLLTKPSSSLPESSSSLFRAGLYMRHGRMPEHQFYRQVL